MRLSLCTLAASIFLPLLTFALSAQLKQDAPPDTPILGFSPPHAAAEHALESTFPSIPFLRDASAHSLLSGTTASAEKIQRVNEQLLQVESNWLDPAGIPGRPWFQHLLYSSRYTYAHLEFPGLTEAVEKGDWKLAEQQAGLLEKASKKTTEFTAFSSILLGEN